MATRPSALAGSAGSRVKVILGESGEDYLYFCDETDGTSNWQSSNWSTGPGSLPDKLARQLNSCSAKHRYITDVAHGPDGEWYVSGEKRDGSGGHAWWGGTCATDSIEEWAGSGHRLQVSFGGDDTWVLVQGSNGNWFSSGVDQDLEDRVSRIHKKSGTINCIRLLPGDGYFISDSEGTEWKVGKAGSHFGDELESGGSDPVLDVAVSADGDWIVIRPRRFQVSTGISDDVQSALGKFYRSHKQRTDARLAEIQTFDAHMAERLEQARQECKLLKKEQLEAERRKTELGQAKSSRPHERDGWVHTGTNKASRVEFYTKHDGSKIDYYYTTGTVKTSIDHPRQGKTQMFRRGLSETEFSAIQKNPRSHTGKGYQRKNGKRR